MILDEHNSVKSCDFLCWHLFSHCHRCADKTESEFAVRPVQQLNHIPIPLVCCFFLVLQKTDKREGSGCAVSFFFMLFLLPPFLLCHCMNERECKPQNHIQGGTVTTQILPMVDRKGSVTNHEVPDWDRACEHVQAGSWAFLTPEILAMPYSQPQGNLAQQPSATKLHCSNTSHPLECTSGTALHKWMLRFEPELTPGSRRDRGIAELLLVAVNKM